MNGKQKKEKRKWNDSTMSQTRGILKDGGLYLHDCKTHYGILWGGGVVAKGAKGRISAMATGSN